MNSVSSFTTSERRAAIGCHKAGQAVAFARCCREKSSCDPQTFDLQTFDLQTFDLQTFDLQTRDPHTLYQRAMQQAALGLSFLLSLPTPLLSVAFYQTALPATLIDF